MNSFQNTQPIYLQIMERIKKDIVSEKLMPGQQVPAVRDLALQFKVNPNTVQRALSELEREGLLHSHRTIGRFVTDDPEFIQELHQKMFIECSDNFTASLDELSIPLEQGIQYLQAQLKEREKQ